MDMNTRKRDQMPCLGMKITVRALACLLILMKKNVLKFDTVVQVDPKEQEDFDQVLKALLQESLESRKLEPRARLSEHMKISMNASEGSKGLVTTETADGENSYDDNGKSGGASKVCQGTLEERA
jgi:hypothetical protein